MKRAVIVGLILSLLIVAACVKVQPPMEKVTDALPGDGVEIEQGSADIDELEADLDISEVGLDDIGALFEDY